MHQPTRGVLSLTAFAVIVLLAITSLGASARKGSPVAGSPIAAASPCATRSASPEATTQARQSVSTSGAVTIYLTDQGFAPSYVESTNGHPLTITLINTGSRPHGFTITRFEIDEMVDPGQTKTIVIEKPDLGDFPFTSGAPCDDGMQGVLVFYI